MASRPPPPGVDRLPSRRTPARRRCRSSASRYRPPVEPRGVGDPAGHLDVVVAGAGEHDHSSGWSETPCETPPMNTSTVPHRGGDADVVGAGGAGNDQRRLTRLALIDDQVCPAGAGGATVIVTVAVEVPPSPSLMPHAKIGAVEPSVGGVAQRAVGIDHHRAERPLTKDAAPVLSGSSGPPLSASLPRGVMTRGTSCVVPATSSFAVGAATLFTVITGWSGRCAYRRRRRSP